MDSRIRALCPSPAAARYAVASAAVALGLALGGCDPSVARPEPAAGATTIEAYDDVALAWNAQDRLAKNRGVVPADFNGDGRLDLFLANPEGGARILYAGPSGPPFRPSAAVAVPEYPTGGLALDFDADGDADLFVTCGGWSGDSTNALLRNDGVTAAGEAIFTDVTDEAGLGRPVGRYFGAAAGDLDGDGDLDLYVSNKPAVVDDTGETEPVAPNLLYEKLGGLRFEPRPDAEWTLMPGQSHQPIMGDFDGDGRMDIVVPAELGPTVLLHNEGDWQFRVEPLGHRLQFAGCAADFDQDGRLDLFLEGRDEPYAPPDSSRRDHALFLQQPDGQLVDVAPAVGLADLSGAHHTTAMGLACGDLDNDGLPDLLVGAGAPEAGATDRLYQAVAPPAGGGRPHFEERTALLDFPAPEGPQAAPPYPPYPYRTHGITFWDFDRDGTVEVFVGNGGMPHGDEHAAGDTREPNRLFRATRPLVPGWLVVELDGAPPNRDAVGARVTVTPSECLPDARSAPRHHFVLAGNAFNGHPPLWVHSGLRGCTRATVAVTWPDGVTRAYGPFEGGTIASIHRDAGVTRVRRPQADGTDVEEPLPPAGGGSTAPR